MATTKVPPAAQRELAAGRLWRARNVLRGAIADASFDPDLFHTYADVLADKNTLEPVASSRLPAWLIAAIAWTLGAMLILILILGAVDLGRRIMSPF